MTKQKPSLHYQLVEEFIEYFADAENKKILQIWIDEAEAKVHEKTGWHFTKVIFSDHYKHNTPFSHEFDIYHYLL
jgi:hypothetical protein